MGINKPILLIVGFFGLTTIVALNSYWSTQSVVPNGSSAIVWNTNLATAERQAKLHHKLLMVDLYTDWCQYCKLLDSQTYPDPTVVKAVDQVEPIKLNGETDPNGAYLTAHFTNQTFPTILFFDPNGKLVHVINTYEPPAPFAAEVNLAVDDQEQLPGLLALVSENPGDTADKITLAQLYIRRAQLDDAAGLVANLEAAGQGDQLVPLYSSLGDQYSSMQNYTAATADYNKIVSLHDAAASDIVAAHFSLANNYLLQNDKADVISQIQAIIATPGAREDAKTLAKQMLAQINTGGLSSLSD
jgi:thioredoxin-related protein